MLDLIYIGLMVAFFILAVIYIAACDAMKKGEEK